MAYAEEACRYWWH